MLCYVTCIDIMSPCRNVLNIVLLRFAMFYFFHLLTKLLFSWKHYHMQAYFLLTLNNFKGHLTLPLYFTGWKLLPTWLTFWLKHFIDWLKGLSCYDSCSNVGRNVFLSQSLYNFDNWLSVLMKNDLLFWYNSLLNIIDSSNIKE